MKRFFSILQSLIFILLISCDNPSETIDPPANDHFNFVLYNGLTENDIANIETNLNTNRQRILDHLKIINMPEVTVKIWGDYTSFLNDMEADIGTRYNGATGYIFSPTELRMFFNNSAAQTVVHEFAHLVTMQINITISNNPRWLWEAAAIYEAQEFVNPNTLTYMVSRNYPTLNQLNSDFNSNRKIYDVGYVLSEFIIFKWGVDLFIELIKTNGNIQSVLNLSAKEFEDEWYNYIEETYLN